MEYRRMRLQLSTWQEVEAYLGRSRGIVIPIGSTEQHGPNGLIGTDAICPETVANGMAEQIDVLVGPTQAIGMAQHHMAFAGSMTLRPSTLVAVLRDQVMSLARHGFERIYFLNGHGGNVATVTAAFSEIYTEISLSKTPPEKPVRCKLRNWYDLPGPRAISKELFGASEGSHATPSEVSLSYFAFPEFQKQAQMTPKVAPRGGFHDAEDYRRRYPDGRIGSDPSLATVDAGRRLYEATVKDAIVDYQEFLAAG
jgi:creatinine amidohydrolase